MCEASAWDRVVEAARKLAADIGPFGLLAASGTRWPAADAYVNGWIAALEGGCRDCAPRHRRGPVRLWPDTWADRDASTPLRFAWHGVYDQLAAHARYEQGLAPAAVQKSMKALDSAHFPAALPGIPPGPGFVFADTIGFHAVAMTLDGEPEPKAAVSLMSACLGGGVQAVAPSIGTESAAVLAREIRHYLDCHRRRGEPQRRSRFAEYSGMATWRRLDRRTGAGRCAADEIPSGEDEDEREPNLCFTLDLYHPPASSSASGGFLLDVGRRRRSGGGVLDARDRWMTETARRPGEIIIPRLRWARRDGDADRLLTSRWLRHLPGTARGSANG